MPSRSNHQPLLTLGELAQAMGYCRAYVSAMVRAGFKPSGGRRSTLAAALRWKQQNPKFLMTQVYPKKKETPAPSKPPLAHVA